MHELSPPPGAENAPRPKAMRQLVDNRWVVLGTLFFVTAALGLPALWISRGFSRPAKVWLTLAVLVYTALLLAVFYMVMAWWVVPTVVESWRRL